MPRHTQNIESVLISSINIKDFNDKVDRQTEFFTKEGLEVSIDRYTNSCGFYTAKVTGYKILKEW